MIKCKFLEGTTKTMINPDGQVWPCCYLASDQYGKPNKVEHQLLTKYHDNKDRYNLENDSIKNITHKDWFQKDLPKSFEDPIDLCQFNCKVNK